MFQFRRFPSHTYLIQYGMTGHDSGRIAPFRHLRINICLRFPAAFRSLPRLSSASDAKAFALRPYSLDPLRIIVFLQRFKFKIVVFPKRFVLFLTFDFSLYFAFLFVQFSSYTNPPTSMRFGMVGTSGLEPPTSRLSGVRSNHLSYAPMH